MEALTQKEIDNLVTAARITIHNLSMSDDIEVDDILKEDQARKVSRAEDHTWIQAWIRIEGAT